MFVPIIFACVLALLAVGSVALAWITFATRTEAKILRGTVEQLRQHSLRFVARLQTVEKQSPITIAAEVAALSEAVGRLKSTQQRFQGRFDQYMGQQRPVPGDGTDDPEWLALMRAQQQLGKPNGSD